MSRLSRWIARWLWWHLLWLTRRPWMRRLQRASVGLIPESKREAAWRSLATQNRFALRHGLTILTVSVNLVFASIVLTVCFYIALGIHDSGVLTLSDSTREQIAGRLR